ncbi:MAG: hypothetical protein V4736_00600 [Bdellovibrionota bacterium]
MSTLTKNVMKTVALVIVISVLGTMAQAQVPGELPDLAPPGTTTPTAPLANGSLVVVGDAGPSQLFAQVKAQRCNKALRKCDAPVYFNLNEAALVPVGTYLVGFENSIYPGWATVADGQTTELALQRLDIPAPVNAQTEVRVFRDFSNPVEMNKQLVTQFYVGKPFFNLGSYGFGDLYLASSIQKSITTRLSYDACSKIKLETGGDPDVNEVVGLCKSYTSAKSPNQLAPFFQALGVEADLHIVRKDSEKVDNRGKLKQIWITGAGLKVEVQLERHLVSAPMRGSDYVAVFPGVYRVMATGQAGNTTQIVAGPLAPVSFQ